MLHHTLDPAHAHGLPLVGLCIGALPRPGAGLRCEAALRKPQERGQQGGSHPDRDKHRDGGAHPHDAEERNADDKQAEQGDDDRNPGENHCTARGADGHRRRLLGVFAPGQLGSMAGQDEERIVDADREADHERQQRSRARHCRERRERDDRAHDDADADERADQGHSCCEQRTEGDEQHHTGKEHSEHLGDGDTDRVVLEDLAAEFDPESVTLGYAGGGFEVGDRLL